MREWVPTRRQLVSDVVAGLLVVAMLAVVIWLSRSLGSLNLSGDLILGLRLGEVVSLAVVFIAAMFGFRTWQIMRAKNQPAVLDTGPQLSEIAKHDLESPASMLKIMGRRVLKWNLEARRSEIEFGVTLFNGTVYSVLVSPAIGNLIYGGQPLETAILPKQGGLNRIPRGQEYEIKLTQYIPDDLAHEAHREITSGCMRMFGWTGVIVSLRADYPNAPDVRIAIGDGEGFRRNE